MGTFTVDYANYFADMRRQGVNLTAEQQAVTERVIREETASGDVFSWITNALMSGWRAIMELISGNSNGSLGDHLSNALDNGQQRGDMHTAAETAHRIRQRLTGAGIPARTAEALTGDTTNQPEISGNLYRLFSNERGVIDRNRSAEREYQQTRVPVNTVISELAAAAPADTARYPVTETASVTAPVTPTAGQTPSAANIS